MANTHQALRDPLSSRDPMTNDDVAGRQAAMRVLAGARLDELENGLARCGAGIDYAVIRRPEVGLVMVRGRIGGTGGPFNIGEATVTRAAVRLADGTVGHAYLLGRDTKRAELAAVVDAIWQTAERRHLVETEILAPIRARCAAEEDNRRAKAAATRVEFFTMQRGED